MPVKLLPLLLLNIITYGISPGPANIFAMSCSMKFGRRRAMRVWWGLLTGATAVIVAVTILCWLLGEALGGWVAYVKYVGAAYILWLAWKIFKNRGQLTDPEAQCSFTAGFMVQLTNVKIILFEVTIYGTFILPYTHNLHEMSLVAPLMLLAGPGCNIVWLIAGNLLHKRLYAHHMRTIDTLFAAALLVCAALILLM